MESPHVNGEDPVSRWVAMMKRGDGEATKALWRLYLERLVLFARNRLAEVPRGAVGESDIAQCAFWSFIHRAQAGEFPQLDGPEELWRILSTIASRKAAEICRKEERARQAHSELGRTAAVAETPTPAEQAAQKDEREFLLSRLADNRHRAIACWREDGFTHEEIAAMLGTTVRSVERCMDRIRRRLDRERQRQIDAERRKET